MRYHLRRIPGAGSLRERLIAALVLPTRREPKGVSAMEQSAVAPESAPPAPRPRWRLRARLLMPVLILVLAGGGAPGGRSPCGPAAWRHSRGSGPWYRRATTRA